MPFTSALSHALTELCSQSTTFTINALYIRILLYQKEGWSQGGVLFLMAPVHLTLVEDQGSSRMIVLCSLTQFLRSTLEVPLNERGMRSSKSSIPRTQAGESTVNIPHRKRILDQISTSDHSQDSTTTNSDHVEATPVSNDPRTSIFATKRQRLQIEDTSHYLCTYQDCPRKYSKFFDWKKHEAQHWKTERWDCLICSSKIDNGTRKRSKVPNFC
jgi:hypothetical protein